MRVLATWPGDSIPGTYTAPALLDCGPATPRRRRDDPPAAAEGIEQATSLLTLYRERMRPARERSAGPAAIAEHETSMRLFDRFVANHHRSGRPMMIIRHQDCLTEWASWLVRDRLQSAVTARKRITHVAMLAKLLGVSVVRPTATELARMVTSLGRPQQSVRRIVSQQEIGALAGACEVARYPYGSRAPAWWRGWIAYAAAFGPRTQDVVST